jgi:phosphoribosylanthranilate isomerase
MRDDKTLEAMVKELWAVRRCVHQRHVRSKTGASGSTGKIYDWRVSRRLVEIDDRLVILAGRLTPENVKRAILEVRPARVDSDTGVEDTSGRKSREKVRKFLSEAYEAFEFVKAK